ncbi:MAG TPA: vWA domain-containing protein [Planctomycetota bacterium]|nr:vWA domain-containing protein [Planctomycetota bacterium]
MPYTAEISRKQATAFLFVLDQSGSMKDKMSSGITKADFVADVLNKTLANLIVRSTKSDGVRNYFDVGVIAYGGKGVGSGFDGEGTGSVLQALGDVAANPLRVEERTKKMDDGAGGLVEQPIKFPVWFEPKAVGGTPMCEAMRQAAAALVEWCDAHPGSYPPTVIHVSDGESTDGDPEEIGRQLHEIATDDGNVLVFNLHIDASEGTGIMFPNEEKSLPDAHSRRLFRMSSALPEHLVKFATQMGYTASPDSRFFGYKVGTEGIVDFFDIGTRASELR